MALESSPRSVQEARRWAAESCRLIGRRDLVNSSELGVTELVTNALLHGEPPISVRMRGTRDHPRVEVHDGSPVAPAINLRMTDEEELLSTFGRGLAMVAMCSHTWGADIQPDGKSVWFEPSATLVDEPDLEGRILALDYATDQAPQLVSVSEGLTIHFEALPVATYVDWRRHFRELRRELRLLSLAHDRDYPVATAISQVFSRSLDEVSRTRGWDDLEMAIAGERVSTPVTLIVPPSMPDTTEKLLELLELADAFCRAERLLALATTPRQHRFQRWYLGEFVRQGRGERPLAWSDDHEASRRTVS